MNGTWTETAARLVTVTAQRDAALREATTLRDELADAHRRLGTMAMVPVQFYSTDGDWRVVHLPTVPRVGDTVLMGDWQDAHADPGESWWTVAAVRHEINPDSGSYYANVRLEPAPAEPESPDD